MKVKDINFNNDYLRFLPVINYVSTSMLSKYFLRAFFGEN